MNSLDRVLPTFEHEETDRVPINGETMDSNEIIKRYNRFSLLGNNINKYLYQKSDKNREKKYW
ncbi:MAG: hypothetical protein ACFFG0_38510 [Candidatus Thorarchaeota archaeon]